MNRREGVDRMVTIGELEQRWQEGAATLTGDGWWARVEAASGGVAELRDGFTTTAAVYVGVRT